MHDLDRRAFLGGLTALAAGSPLFGQEKAPASGAGT